MYYVKLTAMTRSVWWWSVSHISLYPCFEGICPQDWEAFQGTCYLYENETKTWEAARQHCINLQVWIFFFYKFLLLSIFCCTPGWFSQHSIRRGKWVHLKDLLGTANRIWTRMLDWIEKRGNWSWFVCLDWWDSADLFQVGAIPAQLWMGWYEARMWAHRT